MKVSAADGKFTADVDGFNGDAVLSYELKDKNGNVPWPLPILHSAFRRARQDRTDHQHRAGRSYRRFNEYKLTVTGRQSGKTVTVDFQAPAAIPQMRSRR